MEKSSNVSVVVSIFKEGKYFVAYSPSLDLATHGKTVEEARRNFAEIVRIFFEELDELGTADDVLPSLGWAKIKQHYQPPQEVEHKLQTFQVPALV